VGAQSREPATTKARRIAPRLLLLISSSLLGLLLAELAARAFFRSEFDSDLIAEQNAKTSFGAFTRPSRVPGLVYELRARTRLAWNDLPLLAISDHGPYRISETGETTPPENALRIAVLGDSTSFGWRVPFDASYPEVLRRSLSHHFELPIAVRNFSVPGYNSEQERLIFELRALLWKPGLMILHYDHNDWEPAIAEKPATYLEPTFGDNPLDSALVKVLRRRLHVTREIRRRQALLSLEHRFFEDYAYEGPLYDRHLEQLRRIAETASHHGIPVLCLVFDAFLRRAEEPLESEHYRLLHRNLVAELEEYGIHVLELFHSYQRLMADQGWQDLSALWIEPEDAHPSEVGHDLIAQALTQYILGKDLLQSKSGKLRDTIRDSHSPLRGPED
jgi:lysophospholipase L1-like esterase